MRPDEMEAVAALRPDGGFAWIRDRATRTRLWYVDNLCCPSRTTILTGKTSYRTGVLTNDEFAELGSRTIPAYLQDAGYCTGFVGKYLNRLRGDLAPPSRVEVLGAHRRRPRRRDRLRASWRRDGRTRTPGRFITDEIAGVGAAQLHDCLDRRAARPSSRSGPSPRTSDPIPPRSTPASRCRRTTLIRASTSPTSPTSRPGSRRSTRSPIPRGASRRCSRSGCGRCSASTTSSRGPRVRRRSARRARPHGVRPDERQRLPARRTSDRQPQGPSRTKRRKGASGSPAPASGRSRATCSCRTPTSPPTILEARGRDGSGPTRTELDGVGLQQLLRTVSRGHDRFLPLYVPVEAPDASSRPTGEAYGRGATSTCTMPTGPRSCTTSSSTRRS